MTDSLEQSVLDAWRGFLFAHAKVLRALEADMIEQHDLPITWFDLLSRIKQAPGQRLRMHQLEEASLFTRSGITGLADRLEQAGFVRRERSAEDRRGVYLAITQAGIDKIDEVWPDHELSIQNHFGQHLDPDDAKALRVATEKILNHNVEWHARRVLTQIVSDGYQEGITEAVDIVAIIQFHRGPLAGP